MAAMLVATLICSDPACAEEHEATVDWERLEQLMCDCGCALVALAFYDARVASWSEAAG